MGPHNLGLAAFALQGGGFSPVWGVKQMEAFALGDWGSMHRLQGWVKHMAVCALRGGLPLGRSWRGVGGVWGGSWKGLGQVHSTYEYGALGLWGQNGSGKRQG